MLLLLMLLAINNCNYAIVLTIYNTPGEIAKTHNFFIYVKWMFYC